MNNKMNNNMPTPFQKAFAEARKSNKKSFGFNGKVYSTKTVEEKILSDIIKENPRLSNVLNEKNSKIVFADSNRKELNKTLGGGGGLETWFPDDEGPEGYPHPELGKYVFEIYDDKIINNKKILKEAVRLDAIHAMKNDPEWKKMRDDFTSNYKPEEIEWISNNRYPNEKMENESISGYLDRTMTDGYLRGGLNNIEDKYLDSDYLDEYAQAYRGTRKDDNGNKVEYDIYSDKQREIIGKMKDYLSKK